MPPGTKVGAININALYTAELQIQSTLTITGTNGATPAVPLDSGIHGGAWNYTTPNCVVDFSGTSNNGGTQDTFDGGAVTYSSGASGVAKIEAGVTFTINNAAPITAFQTEVDNSGGTLNLNNGKDIYWQPASGQKMINNFSGTVYFGNSSSINGSTANTTWKVLNTGTMEVKSGVTYTLGAWIDNGTSGLFQLDKSGTLSITGNDGGAQTLSFENEAQLLFTDLSALHLSYNFMQTGSSSALTQYSVSAITDFADLYVGAVGGLTGYKATFATGFCGIAGGAGVYGNFFIGGDASVLHPPVDTVEFDNGTTIELYVDAQNNVPPNADIIVDSRANQDNFLVPASAAINMNVGTNNGTPPQGATRTVIDSYKSMQVVPNGNYGSITVSGGDWTGSTGATSYVLKATHQTSPSAALALAIPGPSFGPGTTTPGPMDDDRGRGDAPAAPGGHQPALPDGPAVQALRWEEVNLLFTRLARPAGQVSAWMALVEDLLDAATPALALVQGNGADWPA